MQLTGAQIIIQSLIDLNVEVVFGYPGGQVLSIYDALYCNSNKIRHVLTSGEQGAAFAADGYARSTGKTGVCIATSGPGATNLVTGLASAYMDSVPLVAITGNVPLDLIGRDAFQEVDITGITIPITKHNYMVKDINSLAAIISEAFTIAAAGRPGPVLIDIPKDIQLKKAEYKKIINNQKIESKIDLQKIDEAIKLINQSKRPLLYCGGGVVFSGASCNLRNFIEKSDCPAVFSMMGLSALPSAHERNLGMAGIHGSAASKKALEKCDLIIAVGTRFSDRFIKDRKNFLGKAKIIHIDIDNSEHGKNVCCDLYIKGGAKEALALLTDKVKTRKLDEWNKYLSEFKNKTGKPEKKEIKFSMADAVKTLNGGLDDDAFIVTDVGQHQVITVQNYNFSKPRKFLSSCGLGAMGYGLGAAIGAKIGNSDKTVVLVTGDGSFHMNLNELACAVSENLPIIIVIFNNYVLGLVRQWQSNFYEKRYSATDLNRKTDYVKLARAFGADGEKVDNICSLEQALKTAKKSKTPYIIECIIDKDDSVFPFDINCGVGS